MQVSVEKTSELSRKMTVTIPEELIQEKVNERLKSVASKVRIDGFRPGKVPQKVIQNRYGASVRQEVTGDLVQENYVSALQESNLNPVGTPKIEPVESDKGFVFSAIFDVYPDFTLEGLDNIAVNKLVTHLEASDIDVTIEKLREQGISWHPTEEDAQKGDRLSLKFSGVCDGENFTDGIKDNYRVIIGSKKMIPGFEDQLIGLEAGTAKKIEVNFPDNYSNKKLAGKLAEFDIEVLKVEKSVLPEVDVEFIKAYGVESGNLDDFRADLEINLQRELAQTLKENIKNTVMGALIANIPVSLPVSMVKQELQNLIKQYYANAKVQGIDVKALQLPKDEISQKAGQRVALGLILAKIIQQNDLKAEANEVRAVIDKLALSYEQPEELVNHYYGDKNNLAEIERLVLENAAVDWVLSQVKVTEQVALFSDIIGAAKLQSGV